MALHRDVLPLLEIYPLPERDDHDRGVSLPHAVTETKRSMTAWESQPCFKLSNATLLPVKLIVAHPSLEVDATPVNIDLLVTHFIVPNGSTTTRRVSPFVP